MNPHRLLTRTMLTAACVLVGASFAAATAHAVVNMKECSGSHCAIGALWGSRNTDTLTATLTMDVLLRAPVRVALPGELGPTISAPTCVAESIITVPISATGELTGYATSYFDSPPIYFNDDQSLIAVTEGIVQRTCRRVNPGVCGRTFDPLLHEPLEGTWSDVWTTTAGASLTCATTSAASATCIVQQTIDEPITITLDRTVSSLFWGRRNASVVGDDPFPATMTSSTTLDCAPAEHPNLTVIDPDHAPANPAPGEIIALEAVVLSNGETDTEASTTAVARIDIDADGAYDVTLPSRPVPPLAVDGTHPVAWPDAWVVEPGTHRYEICVDPANSITESNEGDNCVIRTFTVPSLDAPDLVVLELTGGDGATVNQPVTITARVMNSGAAPAGSSVAAATVNGQEVDTDVVDNLAAAGSEAVTFTWTPGSAGLQRLYVCADSTNTVTEANEDNNCAFRDIAVTGLETSPAPTVSPSPSVTPTPVSTPTPTESTPTPPPPTGSPGTSPQPGTVRETE